MAYRVVNGGSWHMRCWGVIAAEQSGTLCPHIVGALGGRIGDNMPAVILRNGRRPLLWSTRPGARRERGHVGTVLAETDGHHQYVVWSMFSDDGAVWDCVGGAYFHQLTEATDEWASRARKDGSHGSAR